jgi:hypothetical protein
MRASTSPAMVESLRRAQVSPERARVFLAIAIFFLLSGLFYLGTWMPTASLDLFEEGHWLGPAADMLAGKVPYRDTFPVHGFLSDGGLDYLLFRFFGPSYPVSVLAHHLISILFHPAIFLVAAAATRKPALAALAATLNIGFSPGLLFDRPVPALLSLALFVAAIGEKRNRTFAFLAGVLGGSALLYALEFGTFVLATELATIGLLLLWRPAAGVAAIPVRAFLLGFLAPTLPFCLFLASKGALIPFFKTSFFDLPRHVGSVWGVEFPPPWKVVTAWIQGQSYIVPNPGSTQINQIGPGIGKRLYLAPALGVAGLAVSALLLWKRRDRALAARIFAVSLGCCFFFRYVMGRFHFEGGNALTGPVFLTLLVALPSCLPGPRRRAILVIGATAAVLAAGAMNSPGRTLAVVRAAWAAGTRARETGGTLPLAVPRGGSALVAAPSALALEQFVRFCERVVPPGGRILDLSNHPGLYFFSNRVNPTRFYQVPFMAPFQEEILRDLAASPPRLVVLSTGTWLDRIDRRPNSQRIPAVWNLVEKAYPLRQSVGGFTIALPGDAANLDPARFPAREVRPPLPDRRGALGP